MPWIVVPVKCRIIAKDVILRTVSDRVLPGTSQRPRIAIESPSGLGRPGGQAPKPQSGAKAQGLRALTSQAIIRRSRNTTPPDASRLIKSRIIRLNVGCKRVGGVTQHPRPYG